MVCGPLKWGRVGVNLPAKASSGAAVWRSVQRRHRAHAVCRRLQDNERGFARTLPAKGTLARGCCRMWHGPHHSQSMLGCCIQCCLYCWWVLTLFMFGLALL